MARTRTTTATAVEEPIVEQNIETTSVVEEPQTVSEEGGNNETTTEGTQTDNGENTTQTTPEDSNNETTTEGTGENIIEGDDNDDETPQTPTEGDNNEENTDTPTTPSLEDRFVEMSGINRPYAEDIMKLPNADYYLPVGSGIDLSKRTDLINEINAVNNPSTEGE